MNKLLSRDLVQPDMTRKPFPNILLGITALGAICTVALAIMYAVSVGKWNRYQAQATDASTKQNLARALQMDILEYRKTHPDIDPILRDALHSNPTPNSPAK